MEVTTRESFTAMRSLATGATTGQTENSTKENGHATKWKVKASLSGKTAKDTRATLQMTNERARAHSFGLMVDSILASGKTASSMELVLT